MLIFVDKDRCMAGRLFRDARRYVLVRDTVRNVTTMMLKSPHLLLTSKIPEVFVRAPSKYSEFRIFQCYARLWHHKKVLTHEKVYIHDASSKKAKSALRMIPIKCLETEAEPNYDSRRTALEHEKMLGVQQA